MGEAIEYYRVVVEILALQYLHNNEVYLFKYDWCDVGIVERDIIVDGHTIIVNTANW